MARAFADRPATKPEALEPAAPPSGEVRKTVTVLFSGVVGSTAIGERLDAEAVRDLMARDFGKMRRVIERHGGSVEKFIGDAIMAVFGIPSLHEDDALRAVRAAAEMRDALAALNATLESERGVTIQARTGITTGEVVAGNPSGGGTLATGDTEYRRPPRAGSRPRRDPHRCPDLPAGARRRPRSDGHSRRAWPRSSPSSRRCRRRWRCR